MALRMAWVFSLCFSSSGPLRFDTFIFSCLDVKEDGTLAGLIFADGLRGPCEEVDEPVWGTSWVC